MTRFGGNSSRRQSALDEMHATAKPWLARGRCPHGNPNFYGLDLRILRRSNFLIAGERVVRRSSHCPGRSVWQMCPIGAFNSTCVDVIDRCFRLRGLAARTPREQGDLQLRMRGADRDGRRRGVRHRECEDDALATSTLPGDVLVEPHIQVSWPESYPPG